MVFTLPKNASQDLHLKNTVMGYRVELPVHMVLTGNDYKMVLASFTYSHTWYNMPDVAGQAHMATFMFQPGPTGAEGSDETWQSIPSKATFSSRAAGYFPQILETIRQILRDINGMTFQHSFHSPRTMSWWLSSLAWKIAWGGWLLQALSLLPGWPDKEMVFLDWGNTCLIHAQERPSGQFVCALWPSGRCSCSGQCQELPIACSARGGALLSSYVL